MRVGQTLHGKWTLEALIGVGGMAAVYAARHRNASRGAVKLLHPALAHDPRLCSRFLREGYVANTVDHPGVVRVLDDDTADDGTVFLVMELLQGETVDARARRMGGRLPAEDVLSIADQVLDVLAAAHAKGILHRDIKPENIFLTTDGRLKVLDFGIAKVRDATKSSATRTGTTMGTPAFMAPEQALGHTREVDTRTDLWAVGATMFTLLTGRFVHEGESGNEVLVRAATRRADATLAVAPQTPPAVAAVVDRALSFERESRFQEAASFQNSVRQTYHALFGRDAVLQAPRGAISELEEAKTVLDAAVPAGLRPALAASASPAGTTGIGMARTASAGPRRPHWLLAVAAGAVVVIVAGGATLMSTRPRVAASSARSAPSAGTMASSDAVAPAVSSSPQSAPPPSASAALSASPKGDGKPGVPEPSAPRDVTGTSSPKAKSAGPPKATPPPKAPAVNPLDRQD